MKDQIQWIARALPKKTILPVLNHINIENGRATAYNGEVALSVPVEIGFSARVEGKRFADAIKMADGKIAISQLDNGSVVVKSKGLTVKVPASSDLFPEFPVSSPMYTVPFPIRQALDALRRFIAEDNARPMFRAIMFRGKSMFASNNVTIAEYWHGVDTNFNFAISCETVEAILALKEEPSHMEIGNSWVRLHYSNGGWLHSSHTESWPDMSRFLDGDWTSLKPVPLGLWKALERVRPFCGELGRLTVSRGVLAAQDASAEVDDLVGQGHYTAKHLSQLEGVATYANFGTPLLWYNDKMRGVTYGFKNA